MSSPQSKRRKLTDEKPNKRLEVKQISNQKKLDEIMKMMKKPPNGNAIYKCSIRRLRIHSLKLYKKLVEGWIQTKQCTLCDKWFK